MNALCCFALRFSLLIDVSLVLGDLLSPQNVTLETLNTHYVLQWDWSQQTAVNSTVTFTAQSLAKYKARKQAHKQDWQSVCVNVTEHRCDFSNAGLHYFGMFLLRVRANTAQQSSRWVQIEFCPDKQAALGPPSSVKLNSVKEDLEIIISDPLSSTNQSMKELSQKMYYLIQYWKKSDSSQETKAVLKTESNVVMLSNLDKWTEYCVRVQSCCAYYNKSSVFSDTLCTQTGGDTSYQKIFGYFLLSLLFFLVVPLLWFCLNKMYTFIKSIFCPSIQLPVYMQELCFSDSDMPQLLDPKAECVCEHLDLNSAETQDTGAAVMDLLLSQDTVMHSRHGSGDSGVYSTEEDSCHTHITCIDVQMEDLCKTKTDHREETHDRIHELCV
ncbi:interleukin-10 receptor subunit beta isoform X2 [Myxocyprinus asiaticus]|uniref:interleukin-10 receptor subunit beta isoform X2 n=1 Tax=Myxocyprinus asiaticus TaxID=70543 RepID=UPI002223A52E|nr:interleukin-10 receptor subunit beta isoform X2 [Myxocyprinus asiaticus]